MKDKAPIRVLLIEDNEGDTRLVRHALTDAEDSVVEVECANRLSSGLAVLADHPVDVVLLDLTLPDSSGLETVVKFINSRATTSPVIVLTGLDDDHVALRAVHMGAQDYLVKGKINPELLSRSIRYAMERQRLLRDLAQSLNALQASEARFRRIIEMNADGVIIVDRYNKTIRYVNPAAVRFYNRRPDELIGEVFRFPVVEDAVQEVDVVLDDSRVRVAELRVVEVQWEDRDAYLISIRDITDRQRAGEALQVAEAVTGQAAASRRSSGNLVMITKLKPKSITLQVGT